MEYVDAEENNVSSSSCYLPHHVVININSTTTKFRVVFDASCKTRFGFSLNDILLKKLVLQDELVNYSEVSNAYICHYSGYYKNVLENKNITVQ